MDGDRALDEEAKRENDPVDVENQESESGDGARPSCDVKSDGPRKACKRKKNDESCSDKSKNRDVHYLLNYFKKVQEKNAGFYYAIQLDEDDNRMTTVFWADARSRMAYNHFGDAVTFDTTYGSNKYQVPFVPFTGINHHGQMVLFGCGLLLDDSESSLTWLLSTWLSAMNNIPPVSFTTDRDRAIQMAVAQVFPRTRHRICSWRILREGRARLAHFGGQRSLFEELDSCINFTETAEDFESLWDALIQKYDLLSNEWFTDVHNARKQWAPVYFRDTFFAALSAPNQEVGYYFDSYVNEDTTIPQFMDCYENALEKSLENEIEADNDTITPLLKTPSEMELQAANLYTKKVFLKFQEELVGSSEHTVSRTVTENSGRYRVTKFKDPDKAYIVTDDSDILKCSCQMFESCGIPCRHVLTIFTGTNVTTLPHPYIPKRWTKHAKSCVGLEKPTADQHETLTSRFNILCLEAIKLAEEGAISADNFKVAIGGIRRTGKNIAALRENAAAVRENAAKVTPSIQKHGSSSDRHQVALPYFKSITWVIENENPTPDGKAAVINLKLQDCDGETELQFRLTTRTFSPVWKELYFKRQQISQYSEVTVINWKVQDTTTGETEVKFQISGEKLDPLVRSFPLIKELLH